MALASLVRLALVSGFVVSVGFVTFVGAGPAGAEASAVASLRVACSPDPVASGHPAACTVYANLGSGAGAIAPSGQVAFTGSNGAITPGTCALSAVNGAGTEVAACSVQYVPFGAGTSSRVDSISVTYSGDDTYTAGNAVGFVHVPATAAAPAALTASCNPGTVGSGAVTTCSAYVYDGAPGDPVATGTVSSFSVSAGPLTPSSCVLAPVNGGNTGPAMCSMQYQPTGPGSASRTESIGFSYDGDAHHPHATTSVTVKVPVKFDPQLALHCAGGPQPFVVVETNSLTCTLSVNGGASAPAPTGSVSWKTGSNSGGKGTFKPTSCALGSAVGSSSQCSITYTPTGAGSASRHDTITATYAGNTLNNTANASSYVAVIPRVHVRLDLSCSPQPVAGTAPVECTAAASADDLGVATGTVAFKRILAQIGTSGTFAPTTCTLAVTQTQDGAVDECSVLYTPGGTVKAGRRDFVGATYGGDHTYAAATNSAPVDVVVLGKIPPQLEYGCGPILARPGDSIACDAIVTATAVYTPTGILTFSGSNGSFSPTYCVLKPFYVNPNRAGCSTLPAYTPRGTGSATRQDTLTVKYHGDGTYAVRSVAYKLSVVDKYSDGVSVSCDPDSTIPTTTTQCTVIVQSDYLDAGVPGGSVSFTHTGSGALSASSCSLVTDAAPQVSGRCAVNYTPSGTGSPTRHDTITAKYLGDDKFAANTATTTVSVPSFN